MPRASRGSARAFNAPTTRNPCCAHRPGSCCAARALPRPRRARGVGRRAMRIQPKPAAMLGAVVVVSFFACAKALDVDVKGSSAQAISCDATCQARVNQIMASSEIIFAHDHLRDRQHLGSARNGGVTAMTV